MNRFVAVCILAGAAVLEAGGDALVRAGLKTESTLPRVGLYLLGASVLFVYARVVNAPPWSFGQLIGIYVVFFFITAQLISWLAFAQPPNNVLLLGGALIMSGGLVIALWGNTGS